MRDAIRTERDVEDKLVRPAVLRAGWDGDTQVFGQFPLRAGRVVTLILGLSATGAAFYVGNLGTIIEMTGKISSFLVGPIVAMFMLGALSKRTNAPGVFVGTLCGLAAVAERVSRRARRTVAATVDSLLRPATAFAGAGLFVAVWLMRLALERAAVRWFVW